MTALCLLCAWRFVASGAAARLRGPVVFFAGFGAAAFAGGTWHGFFSAGESRAAEIVWWLAMVCAGATAAGLAFTGLELLGVQRHRSVAPAASVLLVGYALWAWSDPRFLLSLVASAIGTAMCVAGLMHRLRGPGSPGARLALVGFGMSVLAAIAQQQGFALHPPHVDHNATYHLMLLPALGLVYGGLQRLSAVR